MPVRVGRWWIRPVPESTARVVRRSRTTLSFSDRRVHVHGDGNWVQSLRAYRLCLRMRGVPGGRTTGLQRYPGGAVGPRDFVHRWTAETSLEPEETSLAHEDMDLDIKSAWASLKLLDHVLYMNRALTPRSRLSTERQGFPSKTSCLPLPYSTLPQETFEIWSKPECSNQNPIAFSKIRDELSTVVCCPR